MKRQLTICLLSFSFTLTWLIAGCKQPIENDDFLAIESQFANPPSAYRSMPLFNVFQKQWRIDYGLMEDFKVIHE